MLKILSTENLIFKVSLILVFLIGGFFQILGFTTNTKLSLSLSIALSFFGAIVMLHKGKVEYKITGLIFLLFVVGLISSIVNHSHIINAGFFFMQLFFFGTVFYLVRISKRALINYAIDFLFIISLIQFPVILVQRFSGNFLVNLNSKLNIRDIGFGSFFINEDHAVGFLALLMLVFILRRTYYVRYRSVLVVYYVLTVLSLNSRATLLVLLIVGAYYLFRYSKTILILLTLVGVTLFFSLRNIDTNLQFVEKYNYIFNNYLKRETSVDHVNELIESKRSTRKDVVIYFITQPIQLFGFGPGAYRNYHTNEVFNGHYGQSLWYYRDVGFLGLFISFLLLFYLKRKYPSKNSSYIFLLMIYYSFFTNIFASLAFLFMYNIALRYCSVNDSTFRIG